MKEFGEFIKTLRGISQRSLFSLFGANISLTSIVKLIVIMAIFLAVSKYVRKLFHKRILSRFRIDEGAQFTILRMIHYILVVTGVLLAISSVGIKLTSLAVVFGLIGVGIAFGLQNITSNFVSGIILLFERPIRVSDYVEVGEDMGQVRSINMRSTTVVTLDNITLIVPNSSFIENTITNWSVGDPKIRLAIPVSVAYGSDTELVTRILLKAAEDHPDVLPTPESNVLFREFGDSSLNFELRVWTLSPMGRFKVISALNYVIDAAFRENNVTIPFPQRDVHFYKET
ncbi:mechanosensitive ion channel family protein [Candidatus Poribacteria bacterium]